MKRQIIHEKIFTKHYDGIRSRILFSDLPTNILPTDFIDIVKVEGYYSENNSWDDHTILIVTRDREETDVEFEKSKKFQEKRKEMSRQARLEQYQKLKKEFEP